MKSSFAWSCCVVLACLFSVNHLSGSHTGRALVRHAPQINGTVEGDIQQIEAESVALNGGTVVTGSWFVPGTPKVNLNGSPNYDGTLEGAGSSAPSNFSVKLNGGATLAHVVRRTDPVAIPQVGNVPSPTGSAVVTITAEVQAINWTTLRDLTLEGGVGEVAVPAGSYGNFRSNGTGKFILGIAGAAQASVYNFQNLSLNGQAAVYVAGPVIINLANGFSSGRPVGSAAHPTWLVMNIHSGGVDLEGGCNLYGYVLAPNGAVVINGNAQLVGGVMSDVLIVRGNGVLRLQDGNIANVPPFVEITSPEDGNGYSAPASFTLDASAFDSDGLIVNVEFFEGTTKLGEDSTAPYSLPLNGIDAGLHTYFARATDDDDASSDSDSITVSVISPNQPPIVTLTLPLDGATFIAPSAISLRADAGDVDGSIARVEFYEGTLKIGEDTTAPYTHLTDPLSAGTWVFTAKAFDDRGVSATSASVTVTIVHPNEPPSVAITAPADGTTYAAPASFDILVSASDSDGIVDKVELFNNGVLVGEDLAAPYSFSILGLDSGTYDFVSRATDNALSATDSAPVRITVSHVNRAPIADAQELSTPEDISLAITLTANDADGDGLTFSVVSGPSHGTLSNGSGPLTVFPTAILSATDLTYAPAPGFSGVDQFEFVANDNVVSSCPGVIAITVIPVDDSFTIDAGPDLTLQLPQEFLTLSAQVSDPDSDTSLLAISWQQIEGPQDVLPVEADSLHITPRFRQVGHYVFRVTATDGISMAHDDVAVDVFASGFAYKTYTTTADFEEGRFVNIDSSTPDELRVKNESRELKYIWVANSSKGTVVKIDTETGQILGEYWSSPTGQPKNPSRTTVDYNGSVWCANRDGNSVVHIVTPESGLWIDRNGNGICDTSIGWKDIRPWSNLGGVDTAGGVASAEDECVIHYVRVSSGGTRHISVTRFNDVWVSGTGSRVFNLIDGETGVIKRTEGPVGHGAYGGLTDPKGVLWSTSWNSLLRWDTQFPLNGANGVHWSTLAGSAQYGLTMDPYGNVWSSTLGSNLVYKYSPAGALVGSYTQGNGAAQGIAADKNGHIWVTHSSGSTTVGHLKPDGTWIGNVQVGGGPTGAAVDSKGRIWVTNFNSQNVVRINPALGSIGSDGRTPIGAVDLTVQLDGSLYNYSDMTGQGIAGSPPNGRWIAVFDSGIVDAKWSKITWNALTSGDGTITVSTSSSADGTTYSAPQVVTNGQNLTVPVGRYVRMEVLMARSIEGQSPVLRDLTVGTEGYEPLAVVDQAVLVDAGADVRVDWTKAFYMKGFVWHDGLPLGTTPTAAWQQIAGPQLVDFQTPNQQSSWIWFKEMGTYTFELTGTDNFGTFSDTVTVIARHPNVAPNIKASASRSVAQIGDSVQLLVEVTADDGLPEDVPLSYAWVQLDGPTVEIQHANTAEASVNVADFGIYIFKVVVSDSELEDYDIIEIRVGVLTTVDAISGINAWWPGNGSPIDVVGGHTGNLRNGAAYAPGNVSLGFSFDGTDDIIEVPGSGGLDIGASAAGLTIELWAKPGRNQDVPLIQWASPGVEGLGLWQYYNGVGLYAQLLDTNGQPHDLVVQQNLLPAGVWTHVALTYDKVTGTARLYRNGVIVAEQNMGIFTPRTNTSLVFARRRSENRFYRGTLDEISLYSRPLTSIEVQAIYKAGSNGKSPVDDNTSPIVNGGPDLVLANVMGVATLTGTVLDDGKPAGGALAVSWTKHDGPGSVTFADAISAATTATFDAPGTYLLRLDANDGLNIGQGDLVEVRVGLNAALDSGGNLSAWWPANGHVHELISGNHDVELVPRGVSYGPGEVSQGFVFDGVSDYGRVAGHADLNIGASAAGLTIELWAKPSRNQDVPLVQWATSGVEGLGIWQYYNGIGLYAQLVDTNGQPHDLIVQQNLLPTGVWSHVALTYDKLTGTARLYRNGVMVAEQNMGIFTPRTTSSLIFGRRLSENRFYQGTLDEISFYSRPLSTVEVQAIFNAGSSGKSPIQDNASPIVDAGPDLVLANTTGVAPLAGTATDDGKPDGGYLLVSWSKYDGPGTVTFADATDASTTATFSAAGTYVLRLDANDGLSSASSDLMEVRVGVTDALESLGNQAAWWPANGHVHEVINGNHDVEFVPRGVSYGPGQVSQGFVFNGVSDYGRVPGHSDLNIGASSTGLTVELWAKPARNQDVPMVQWASAGVEGLALWQYYNGIGLYAQLVDTSGQPHDLIVQQNLLPAGVWTHVALTYDKLTGIARLYRNGVMVAEQNMGIFTPRTTQSFILGRRLSENRFYQGTLDEISLYTRPLTSLEVQAIYNAGSSGKSPIDDNAAPVANAGPDLDVATVSDIATLNGTVTDDGKPAGGALIISWSKYDGPGTVTFDHAASATTTVTFSAPGTYVLRLDANDGLNTAQGDLTEVRVALAEAVESVGNFSAWWPANGHVHEVINGNHDVAFVPRGVRYGPGEVSQGFVFDGISEYGRVAAHGDLNIGESATGLTIELWAKPARNQDVPLVQWASAGVEGLGLWQYYNGVGLFAQLLDTNGQPHDLVVQQNLLPAGVWTHVALTYDKVTGMARLYRNGVVVAQQNMGIFTPRTTTSLIFGRRLSENRFYQGTLDEICLYSRPLTSGEIQAIHAAGTSGKTPLNSAPIVSAGTDRSCVVDDTLSLSGFATDDGRPNPPGALTYLWSKVSGPGSVVFTSATAAETTATFDTAGSYVLRLTASDSLRTGEDEIEVTVTSLPPTVALTSPANNATIAANVAVTLTATAADADGTVTLVEFFDGEIKLGEDLSAPFSLLVSSGFSVGTHTLTAKATDNSGTTTTSANVSITSAVPASSPPTISIFEPSDGASLLINSFFEIAATVVDSDGTIAKVEFFEGSTKLGQQTLPALGEPTTYFWPLNGGLPAGSYTFTAKATDNTGVSTTSAPVTIDVSATPSDSRTVYIDTPREDSRVSAPTSITGLIVPPGLTSWSLQYRLRPSGDDTSAAPDPWLTSASGTSAVGTAASFGNPAIPDVIGTFDPTLLINGLYEVRLVAVTSATTITTAPIALVVEGNMKIGAFTLAFEDLRLPLAGIPITLTRTYDSRDTRVGDFGPGWRLALSNVRVQKNRNLGRDWWQTPPPDQPVIQFYDVLPIRERVVTVVFPDGETHRFRAGALIKNRIGDPDYTSFGIFVFKGKYRFYALGDTTAKLEPINASNELMDDFWIDGGDDQDLMTADKADFDREVYNPTRFRLTSKEGTVYIVDETLGLLSMSDLSGNTLSISPSAITSTQAAPDGPITQSIAIHRTAAGTIDYVTDPAGNDLDYGYDVEGRLESFTDRESNTTQFRYEDTAFPYYLTKILDPRGVTALRSEFDASGKLIKQIDADGRETVFSRGIDATGRFEKITDRLGNATTYYYDDRGNVTLKMDPLGAQTSFSYYPDSDWVKFETDHYGNVKSTARDARGNVTVETIGASASEDPANPTTGHSTRTTYNSFSAPTRMTDPDGRVQTFTYDPLTNNLLTHTVGFGGTAPATTTYTYNADGTSDTITDALNTVTSHTYDYAYSDANYPGAVKQITVKVTDAAAAVLRVSSTLYDSQENMVASIATRTLPEGGTENIVTRYLYDSENRLKATVMPDGRVTETRYTSFGQTDKSVLWKSLADYEASDDSLARITSFGYDDRGNQTSTTYSDNTRESSHFDLEGRRDWSEDRLGRRTTFAYDDVGRLRFTYQPDATPGDLTDNPYTETVYDLIGRVTDTYDELRHRSSIVYFADGTANAGRRKQSVQALSTGNLITSYQYDAAGKVRYVTDPRNNTVETQYDDHGRPTTVLHPATDEHPATSAITTYDVLGRRVAMTDQQGKVSRYRYDGLGRLLEVRQYIDQSLAASDTDYSLLSTATGLAVTRYAFDEVGSQLSQTDARGNATNYRYDSLGRRTQRILPDSTSESLQYDEWGNLWKRTDFAGKTTTFGYDVLDRLKTKTADTSHPSLAYSHAIARIEYDYDGNGARTAARTFNASDLQLYVESTPRDERGRLDSKTTGSGTLSYTYYANSLLEDVVSSNTGGANVGYRYDEANRLAYVDDASSGTVQTTDYTYNANGSLATFTTPNGVGHAYGYNTLNRLRTLNVTKGLTTLRSYDYQLHASGHRKKIVEAPGRTLNYVYDGIDRLTSETSTGGVNGTNGTVGYTLDKVGNREARTSSVTNLASQSFTFNARDQLSSDSYDSNGNTTLSVGVTGQPDVYDFEDRLIIRRNPDGSTINLGYNADGIRIQKTILDAVSSVVSTTRYLIDTNNLTGYAQVLEETKSIPGGTTSTVYSYGSDLISQSVSHNGQPSTLSYFAYDGLGSVRQFTDATGAVTDTWDYDAFGNVLSRTGTTENAYLYRGEQFDLEVGLYYLRARYMNPDSGRFWNADGFEGENNEPISLHKYLYANGDPIMFADPTGHFSDYSLPSLSAAKTIALTIGAIAVVATYKFTQSIADASGGLGGEIGEDALGRAAAGFAMSAAAIAIIEYQSLHDHVKRATEALEKLGKKLRKLPKVIPMPSSVIPKVAQHVADAQASGKPMLLTRTTASQARINRRRALKGLGSAGLFRSWDEYPFASSVQSSLGVSSVRDVPAAENFIQGGIIGASYGLQGINVGDNYLVIVIP